MKFCILAGSPRKHGNTAALLIPFTQTLTAGGADHSLIRLYEKNISGCMACRTCQQDWTKFGCAVKDDAHEIFDEVLSADTLVLAAPIYSWYCPAPMKALLDRLVYGMNKYYGETKGPSLWAGKRMALLLTCGYRPENGADLFVDGMKRYCKHSALVYAGSHAERDLGYNTVFMDEEKAARTADFAKKLLERR